MRSVTNVLALLLWSRVATAQDRVGEQVSAAMATLNVVLPREVEQELALSAAPDDRNVVCRWPVLHQRGVS